MGEVPLSDVAAVAARLEELGFDGALTTEAAHDPFLPITLAATSTTRLRLGTSIALAFPRSPMVVAAAAHDLHRLSRGRFTLGLGSQVKAHIVRRFGMSWAPPVGRMREYILALRAIWGSWENGTPLRFEGEHYRHTLKVPLTDPGPSGYGTPPILLAAVGERMTELAGEVAGGILVHAFTTAAYLRAVTIPRLERGRARSGGSLDGFEVVVPVFLIPDDVEDADRAVRQQIAFYGSTLAYRPVLEHHGWGDLQTELHALSRAGRWVEMGRLIDDEVLAAFAVRGDPGSIAKEIGRRFGDIASRVVLTLPPEGGRESFEATVCALKASRECTAW